ncbi:predicted protein [Aspergillus terreus NIH2624]|uniref:Uncharacterized protein n=1 Tax=Aspergillus terreus (strain NIH 2624 / FGSC A1156) TaxID=341663 RepID=Q0D108_ASPTN|nr:uncharacterized protein ATEG_00376 [Aspergillus terreus NIH2624]EAU39022.1 predicted protein [Aspergillus terreus NIH2624]
MNPYLSWAILLVVAGGLGYYYNGPTTKAKAPIKPIVEKTEPAPAAKKPKRKAKKSPEPSAAPSKKEDEKPAFALQVEDTDKPDAEIDHKEMAKRFAAVKNGTPLQGSTKSQKKKNKKATASSQPESGASERSASRVSTRTSSTTGAEADDDLSPAGSPMVKANVLFRVAICTQLVRRSAARLAKAKPAAQSNAWQTKPVNPPTNGTSQAAPVPAPNPKVDLLDTFEPTASTSSKEWDQGLPSEEEQMRILGANGGDQWTTVSSKKIKKKGGKADESEASAPETQPEPVAPAPVEPKVKVTPTYLPDALRSGKKGHPLDSDWAA